MPNSKRLLKMFIWLVVWSILFVTLIKLQGNLANLLHDNVEITTTKRLYPDDVLIDKRPGKNIYIDKLYILKRFVLKLPFADV